MAWYLDTSALVKLVVHEPETPALRRWLAAEPRQPVASDLVRTELMRAVRRTDPALAVAARSVLDAVTLTELTPGLFDGAGLLDPAVMRTLDALHLAAALDLGDDLDGLVTYDDRLGAAAALVGIAVVAPA